MDIKQQKQTHRYREQTSGYQWGEGRREGHKRGKGLRGTNYYRKANELQGYFLQQFLKYWKYNKYFTVIINDV